MGRVKRLWGRAPTGVASNEVAPTKQSAFAVLLARPLFDTEWYALRAGLISDGPEDREELVRHYLRTPLDRRVPPQPLFDPEWFAARTKIDLSGKDPFLTYLRR